MTTPLIWWRLASDHPETMIGSERTSNTISAPLDLVVWNDQTPTSSGTKLALEFRSRYDPISGWALARSFDGFRVGDNQRFTELNRILA